jgi:hypothetical protein
LIVYVIGELLVLSVGEEAGESDESYLRKGSRVGREYEIEGEKGITVLL